MSAAPRQVVSGMVMNHTRSWLTAPIGNDDGISVIDITDPSNPAYCFVSIRGLSTYYQPRQMHPLSGTEYVHAYYPSPSVTTGDAEADIQTLLTALQGYERIDRQALFESWPTEYGSEIFRLSIDIERRIPNRQIPSLADLAIVPTMEYALQTDDFSGIADSLMIPGRLDIVRNHLKGIRPIPNSAMSLLCQVVSRDELDEGRLIFRISDCPPNRFLILWRRRARAWNP
ncbi:hypothetical protein NEOLEDRAFT_1232954 [Neolentinus lepideus HHB14362 ss-1]|uniref:Uncharacterized protein n=1 Tax=Neolentinus lepideus HHB14362 ss-1 TaxID=1314782 RepID=A0A165NDI8_9AGAM|nr:hypothetical protein NEOLEDRAFT_1232954 [Neolentinus lepideus HHB14362 ss-1]